jgi:hypothetical protein
MMNAQVTTHSSQMQARGLPLGLEIGYAEPVAGSDGDGV